MGKRANGEGSVFKRKSDGLWIGYLTITVDGKTKRPSVSGKTQAIVREKLQTLKREYSDGRLVVGKGQTVGTFLRSWLDDSARHCVKPRTYESYDLNIRRVDPYLGKMRLKEYPRISADDLRFCFQRKAAGTSDSNQPSVGGAQFVSVPLRRRTAEFEPETSIMARTNACMEWCAPRKGVWRHPESGTRLPCHRRAASERSGVTPRGLWRIFPRKPGRRLSRIIPRVRVVAAGLVQTGSHAEIPN